QKATLSDASENPELIEANDGSGAPIGVDLMHGNTKGITIYPNPTNDHILVSVAGKSGETRQISMVNTQGQQVIMLRNRRENTFLIDVSGLRSGIYSIEVASGRQVSRKKWVKR
ncbi:MAG TPA: T9SS type A sorting domain-containing protein, partial [Flavobacterium sp.]|nr:T9SS type A sorting domain-containing protein [Flavobacterium sp.]